MEPVQPRAGAPATASPWQALSDLLRELPGLVSDRFNLFSLELKRTGVATVHIVALGLGAAILLATAWLALWAGVVVGLMQSGVHWAFAFGLVLLANVGGAAWAVLRIKRLAPLLGMPATLRHLSFAPAPAAPIHGKAEPQDKAEPNAAAAHAGVHRAATARGQTDALTSATSNGASPRV